MTGRIYKIVVLISFLILVGVQLKLIYNTYTLLDRDFNLKEKKLLNDEYGKSIPNDKVYTGGGRILDSILKDKMPALKAEYLRNKNEFGRLARQTSDIILSKLTAASTMDSVFRSIVKRNGLDTSLHYLLTVQALEINFDQRIGDITIFKKMPYGAVIDGNLGSPTPENRVTSLAVSGSLLYDYRITFYLFADYPNRSSRVAYQMLPTFSLVVLCILIIIGINYYTYISWMRQKKDAAMKSDFLNSIKHEFNTPVTTIMVAGKSLNEDEVLSDRDRVKALGQIIERQARRLHTHINQMLEVSMLQEKIHMEETDLNEAISILVEDYRLKLRPSDELLFKRHPAELLVPIDRFVFSTMMQNMLDNAFKHNSKAERSTVITIEENSEYIVLVISDNGNGIEQNARNMIFNKFYRLPRNSTLPGLGLGLYYVKQCLDIHGWDIKLDSELGQGTTFLIYIPKYLLDEL
ncbi:sensor histidine kinase [Pedobacter deserti]|uniref:sensor histidine kinase n=1 Tax=Pedobacter deserti TaxID=2817382 RepID=UPI00210BFE0C|nr:HAMP domain-containing sensor histidine kinase [Pedobacter sp. SYSU D00382]